LPLVLQQLNNLRKKRFVKSEPFFVSPSFLRRGLGVVKKLHTAPLTPPQRGGEARIIFSFLTLGYPHLFVLCVKQKNGIMRK